MTFWICSSFAPSCITTTIFLLLRFVPLDAAAFVDDSLEQPLQTFFVQRALVLLLHAPKDVALAFGIVHAQVLYFLDLSNFNHASCPLIQKLEKLSIDLI